MSVMDDTIQEMGNTIDQLRARVAELDKEKATLQVTLEMANDAGQDAFSTVELIGEALKVPEEPHQGRHHIILGAAYDAQKDRERLDWLKDNWWRFEYFTLPDGRFQWRHKSRGGVAVTLRQAIDNARGEEG